MIEEEKEFQDRCRQLIRDVERTVEDLRAFDVAHPLRGEAGAIDHFCERFGHNPPVTIYTDAWLNLAVLGLVSGRTYDHVTGPVWWRWLWERAAAFVIRRLFREREAIR